MAADINSNMALLTQIAARFSSGADLVATRSLAIGQNSATLQAYYAEMRAKIAKYESIASTLEAGGSVTPPPVVTKMGLVVEGDSIDAGGGANTLSWVAQYSALTGTPVKNIATQGHTLSYIFNNYFNEGGPGPAYSSDFQDFVLGGGTNDIALDAQSVNRIAELHYGIGHRAQIDSGYVRRWIMTIPPRTMGVGGWTQAMEDKRIAVNSNILKDYKYYGFTGVIDRAAYMSAADTHDGIHWTNAGALKHAQAAAAVMSAAPVVADEILNADGTVNMTARNLLAANYWNDAGANHRYGPASAPISGLPTYTSLPPDKQVGRGYPAMRVYQFGDFVDEYTDYSSTETQFAFVPDDPVARIGAGGIQGISFSNYAGSVKPINNWTRGGNKGMDGVEAQHWRDNGHPTMSKPTCSARGQGRPTWNVQTFFFFQDGSFCTVGTNTDSNRSYGQLAPGKVPTSACIMSSNEFALVTVWDVNTNTAEVAVIFLCGLGHGSSIEDPHSGEDKGWWGEWNAAYPGLQNLGNNVFFKVVDYIPLPNMKAPTGISCTSGQHRHAYLNGTPPLTNGALSNWVEDESVRQRWCAPNGDRCTNLVRQGMFMVWSKSEQRVEFFDLRPTFDYINKYYFGTRADFLKTRDIGQGKTQWPFDYSVAPEQRATFIKAFTLPSKPTAGMLFAYAYNNTHRQAHLCLENGIMWTFNCGKYAEPFNGQPGAEIGVPALLVKVAETPVPRNVVSIQQSRERGPSEWVRDSTRMIVMCSREEKCVAAYDMASTTGPGTQMWKLQDSRLVDPVAVEDMENHGTTSFIVNVADYNGKAIHAYAFGPIQMWTMGGLMFPLANNEKFNYFGKYPVEGKAFGVHGANVS